MIGRSRRPLRAGLLALLCVMTAAVSARAQSLGMAPAEVRAAFAPGAPMRFTLTVSNDGEAPLSLRGSVTDFWFNERNEKVFDPPGTHARSAADWIEFVPRELTVPGRTSATVNVLVTPPPEADGGYYAVVFMESRPVLSHDAAADRRALYTNMRLGALVLLSAQGTESYDLQVLDAAVAPPSATQPLQFTVHLENRGNTHVFPHATLAVLDAGRRLVARAEGEPRRLLPSQREVLAVGWPGTLPPGQYLAILTLTYGDQGLLTREVPFTIGALAP